MRTHVGFAHGNAIVGKGPFRIVRVRSLLIGLENRRNRKSGDEPCQGVRVKGRTDGKGLGG
jgi:hypothetical protein